MWLTVATHLELYHPTIQLKLRQNVFIEFPEIKTQILQHCTTIYNYAIQGVEFSGQ
jgi:hypothetical protein